MDNKENIAEKKNRSRGDNWTQDEKDIFMEIMQGSASIIENKKTDTNTNRRKHLEWLNVQNKIRELTGKSRNIEQLKGFWRRAKVVAKKSVSQHRRALHATGGGQPPPSPSTDDIKIMDLCPTDFIIDENVYDSDAVSQHTGQKKVTLVLDDDKELNSTIYDSEVLELENVENTEATFLNQSVTIADVSENETESKNYAGSVNTPSKKESKKIFKKKKCENNNTSKAFLYGSNIELKKRAMELMEEEFKLKIDYQKQEKCHQQLRQKFEIDLLMLEKEKKMLEIEILKKKLM